MFMDPGAGLLLWFSHRFVVGESDSVQAGLHSSRDKSALSKAKKASVDNQNSLMTQAHNFALSQYASAFYCWKPSLRWIL